MGVFILVGEQLSKGDLVKYAGTAFPALANDSACRVVEVLAHGIRIASMYKDVNYQEAIVSITEVELQLSKPILSEFFFFCFLYHSEILSIMFHERLSGPPRTGDYIQKKMFLF